MEYLLFVIYLFLFAWLVTKIRFFTHSGLTRVQLITLFLLKVTVAIIYSLLSLYIARKAHTISDTWDFHRSGLHACWHLLETPIQFLASHFRNDYRTGYGNFFTGKGSWWQDLPNNVFILMLGIFNLFSLGSYYINTIFYSFISFFGPVAMYRVMMDTFPGKKTAVLAATFLIPSFLYWASGIHKEGLLFVGLAMIVYNMHQGLKANRFTVKKFCLIILGMMIVLVTRTYILLPLLPFLFAWFLSEKLKYKPILVFGAVLLLSILFFFTAKYLHPKLDFPAAIAEKQKAFLSRKGNSEVPVDELKPTAAGFLKNAPEAFALAVLRPYPPDVKNLFTLVACTENLLLLLLFLIFLFRRKRIQPVPPFLLFCLFLSFTVLLIIGYTVNFIGAIVRYRSIVLPFLVIPMTALIDWNKAGFTISKKH